MICERLLRGELAVLTGRLSLLSARAHLVGSAS